MVESAGFVPPPYPYDRLDRLVPLAQALDGGVVDLSIGTPCDPPLDSVIAALSTSNAERGYPPSIGTDTLRQAIRSWLDRRFDLDVPLAQLAACIGTKEFVATTPQYLRLRTPSKDTVLFPAVAYPTYEMGVDTRWPGCHAACPLPSRRGHSDFSNDQPADTYSGPDAVGQQSVELPRKARSRDLRRGSSLGAQLRRAGVQRRVLRRVSVG